MIIDNEEFVNDVMPRRQGSLMDSNNLDILFEGLGFKVGNKKKESFIRS